MVGNFSCRLRLGRGANRKQHSVYSDGDFSLHVFSASPHSSLGHLTLVPFYLFISFVPGCRVNQ